jgi:hypothetical protein
MGVISGLNEISPKEEDKRARRGEKKDSGGLIYHLRVGVGQDRS